MFTKRCHRNSHMNERYQPSTQHRRSERRDNRPSISLVYGQTRFGWPLGVQLVIAQLNVCNWKFNVLALA